MGTVLRRSLSALLGSLALMAVWGVVVLPGAPRSSAAAVPTPTPLSVTPPRRESSGVTVSPAISSIDSPSATCYRPIAGTGACYIQWSYLSVTAAPGAYVVSMTVAIDNQLRAYHSGFFQNYMYVPGDMWAPGFRVTCGTPGSGGQAELGRAYSYVIRARETSGQPAANYGTAMCPADVVAVYLPSIQIP